MDRLHSNLSGLDNLSASLPDDAEVKILQQTRHGNKLKIGHLRGNRFSLQLENVEINELSVHIAHLAASIPNFYGHQRYGRDGFNLRLAELAAKAKNSDAMINACVTPATLPRQPSLTLLSPDALPKTDCTKPQSETSHMLPMAPVSWWKRRKSTRSINTLASGKSAVPAPPRHTARPPRIPLQMTNCAGASTLAFIGGNSPKVAPSAPAAAAAPCRTIPRSPAALRQRKRFRQSDPHLRPRRGELRQQRGTGLRHPMATVQRRLMYLGGCITRTLPPAQSSWGAS